MNLIKRFLFITPKVFTLMIIFGAEKGFGQCINLGEPCSLDCDCCSKIIDPVTNTSIFEPKVRCEVRNQKLGRRCYFSRDNGSSCVTKYDCKSQVCQTGVCKPSTRVPKKVMDLYQMDIPKAVAVK